MSISPLYYEETEAICSCSIMWYSSVPYRMLHSSLLVTLVCSVLVPSLAAPHGATIEHVHYDQQQHASGNNLRLNMNKILVAILPLEDALSGLGLGGGFGGSTSDYDDFADLTLEDLKPPPPPVSSEPDVEDAQDHLEEATAEVVPASEANVSSTEESTKASGLVRVRNKATSASGTSCTRGDQAAGRCKRQRRYEGQNQNSPAF